MTELYFILLKVANLDINEVSLQPVVWLQSNNDALLFLVSAV